MLSRRAYSYQFVRRLHHSRSPSVPRDIAFAFEFVRLHIVDVASLTLSSIDGVLLRSSQPVGGAPEAVSQLQTARVPFIFLTNGGGKSELARIQDLRDKLRAPKLEEESIVQSHTPFRGLSHLHDKNVLVVGGDGDKCRMVAERRAAILPTGRGSN